MRKSRILILTMFAVMAVIWVFHYFEIPLYEWTRPLILIPIVYASIHYGDLGMTGVLLFMVVGQAPLVINSMKGDTPIVSAANFLLGIISLSGLGVIMGVVVRKDRKSNTLWKNLKNVRERIFDMDSETDMISFLCEIITRDLNSEDVKCYLMNEDGMLENVIQKEGDILPADSMYYKALETAEYFVSIDPGKDPRLEYAGEDGGAENLLNIAVLPLSYGDDHRGVIIIINSKVDDFGEEAISFVSEIKNSIENALSLNEKRHETIKHMIRHEEIREMFSSYVSQSVADEILKNPDSVELGGDNFECSVMFTKIRNFKALRKELPAEKLFNMLNKYFEIAAETVFEHGGTLDKFIDDGVMAFWGAPLKSDDYVEQSVKCAMKIIERLKVLNEDWRREGNEEFKIGIGINQGQVIAGNIGGEKRMEYTVIGDTVNTASRIKGMTTKFSSPLLVSESVYEKVKNQYDFDETINAEVKGKSGIVQVRALRINR